MSDDRFARIKFRHAEILRAIDEHGVMDASYERELLDMISDILNAMDDAIARSIFSEREECAKIAEQWRFPRVCIYPEEALCSLNKGYDAITANSDAIIRSIRARNEREKSVAS